MGTSRFAYLSLIVWMAILAILAGNMTHPAHARDISFGDDAPKPTLEWEVAAASRIGRFRIVGVRPAYALAGDRNSACGYLYRATVVETLKGASSPLEFYSIHSDLKIDSDYLLFIRGEKRTSGKLLTAFDKLITNDLNGLVTTSEAITMSCRVRSSNFYLPVDTKHISLSTPMPQHCSVAIGSTGTERNSKWVFPGAHGDLFHTGARRFTNFFVPGRR